MLIKLLILFFILLFIYQLYYYFNTIQEGFATSGHSDEDPKYQGYGGNPAILAVQNAGNISYLNEQIKQCTSNADQISSLTTQVNNIQKQVNAMATSQSSQFTGSTNS
jgi:hypothetical protein